MKLIPFENITIELDGDPNDIVDSIRQHVEPAKILRMPWSNTHPFEGTVDENGFRITRILDYANACRPILYGHFELGKQCTILHVKFRLPPLAFAISLLSFLPAIFFGFTDCLNHGIHITKYSGFAMSLVLPLLFTIFALAGYWVELSRSKTAILAILKKYAV